MKKIRKVDGFSKISINNNSSQKSSIKEKSFNIESKVSHLKNLKKLYLISPKLSPQVKSHTTKNNLNIKLLEKKYKNFLGTTNKFYHSSLSSLSYSRISNERKKMKSEKFDIKGNKDKIVILKLNNKNNSYNYATNHVKIIPLNKTKTENIYSTNFTSNNNSDNKMTYYQETSNPSINEFHSAKNFYKKKNKQQIKQSDNNIDYLEFINKKYQKLNNIRKNKKNSSHISSNAISNDFMNKYENFMTKKDYNENNKKNDDYIIKNNDGNKSIKNQNKLQYYSFNDIISGLYRNINLIEPSPSIESNLKLLRDLDELIELPSIPNIQEEKDVIPDRKGINSYKYYKTKGKIYKNKLNETEKLSLSADINIKELSYPNYTKITYNKNDFKKTALTPKENFDKNEILEDLKFLGISNRLNWNLISEEDKKKGIKTWNKLLSKKEIKSSGYTSNTGIIKKDIYKKEIPKSFIKNNSGISERRTIIKKPRQPILLKPNIESEPIKFKNHNSPMKSNSIFKINKKFIFSDNNIDNKKDKSDKPSVKYIKIPRFSIFKNKQQNKINKQKLKSRLSYINISSKILNSFNKPKKIKKRRRSVESHSDSDLNEISEESLSIPMQNNKKNEKEESYDDNINENLGKLNHLTAEYKQINILSKNKNNREKNLIQDTNNNKEKREQSIEVKNNEQEENEDDNIKNELNKENEINEGDNKDEIKDEEKKEEIEENKKDKNKVKVTPKENKDNQLYLFMEDKENKEILLNHLKSRKKKKKILKKSILDFLKDSKYKNNLSNNEKELLFDKPKPRKYFKNLDINSIEEINKRKLELLLRMKHDLEFKIIKGYIKSFEKFEFQDFAKKIYNTNIKSFDEKGINEYLDMLEGYFSSFENDMINAEHRKKDEERINGFRNDLIDKMNFAEILREKREMLYAKVIDFNFINHINELSVFDKVNEINKENELI